MQYRTSCSATLAKGTFAALIVMLTLCFAPYSSAAQGSLPVQWMYSPITAVTGVAYSPDGTRIAISGIGGIQILTLSTGAITSLPTAASEGGSSVAFSPDSKTLADGGVRYAADTNVSTGVLELWNVATGALTATINTAANKGVDSVAFSIDGKTLADGGGAYNPALNVSTGVLEVWDVATTNLVATLKTAANGHIWSVALSSDGSTLADGGESYNSSTYLTTGVLELWNISTASLMTTLKAGAAGTVNCVAFSPDGNTLADGGYNASASAGLLELWNVSSGKRISTLSSTVNQGVWSISFSPDGGTLADHGIMITRSASTIDTSAVLELWDVSTNRLVTTLDSLPNAGDGPVVYSPDGGTLACGIGDGLQLWSLSARTLTTTINTATDSQVNSIAFSPDGTTLANGATLGSALNNQVSVLDLWNISNGGVSSALDIPPSNMVQSVAFSPDGKLLATGGGDFGALEIWNLSTGNLLAPLNTAANNVIWSVAFSPDKGKLAIAGQNYNPSTHASFAVLELWDVSNGNLITRFTPSGDTVYSLAFSPDGTVLASGGDSVQNRLGLLQLWNVSNGKLITTLNTTANSEVSSVAFSPDGTMLADCGSNLGSYLNAPAGVLELWNVSTGTLIAKLNTAATGGLYSVAFSPDSKTLADCGVSSMSSEGDTTGVLELWNVANCDLLTQLDLTNIEYRSVAFSPNGKTLAYGTNTGMIVVATNPYSAAALSVTNLSPTSATAGAATFTLTVNGAGFTSGATLNWNGSALATTYVSPTQLTATIPTADLTTAGTYSITASNPSPGGGTSNAINFTVNNAIPALTSVSPGSTAVGSGDTTITLTGVGFAAGAQGEWNGHALATTYVSPTQLTASVPAVSLTAAGTFSVAVTNPAPGGGTSPAVGFTVNNLVPALTGVSPNSTPAASGDTVITLIGSAFTTGTQAHWNGGTLSTTYVSPTELTATVPAGDLTTTGTFNLTVTNPTAGGGTSAAILFTVTHAIPAITNISPNSVGVGNSAAQVTLTGSGFTAATKACLNGTAVPTTYVSATQLSATVAASKVAAPAVFSVTVEDSASGNVPSNSSSFTVNAPAPVLTSINPSSTVAGSADVTITVSGSNFVGASLVQINGVPISTTFIHYNQITAVVPASYLTDPAAWSITVVTRSPGGGTSAAQTFSVK